MDPNFKDTLNTLIARIDQMDQRQQKFKNQADASCKDLVTWLDMLETNQKRIPGPLRVNEPRDNSKSPLRRRAQPFNTENTYTKYMKV